MIETTSFNISTRRSYELPLRQAKNSDAHFTSRNLILDPHMDPVRIQQQGTRGLESMVVPLLNMKTSRDLKDSNPIIPVVPASSRSGSRISSSSSRQLGYVRDLSELPLLPIQDSNTECSSRILVSTPGKTTSMGRTERAKELTPLPIQLMLNNAASAGSVSDSIVSAATSTGGGEPEEKQRKYDQMWTKIRQSIHVMNFAYCFAERATILEAVKDGRFDPEKFMGSITDQGNLRFYSFPNQLKRLGLRNDPQIKHYTAMMWNVTSLGHDENDASINFTAYLAMAKRLHSLMFKENQRYRAAELLKTIEKDWEEDANGKESMCYEEFHMALYRLVDLWTDSVDKKDYLELMRVIFEGIIDTNEEGRSVFKKMGDVYYNPIFVNESFDGGEISLPLCPHGLICPLMSDQDHCSMFHHNPDDYESTMREQFSAYFPEKDGKRCLSKDSVIQTIGILYEKKLTGDLALQKKVEAVRKGKKLTNAQKKNKAFVAMTKSSDLPATRLSTLVKNYFLWHYGSRSVATMHMKNFLESALVYGPLYPRIKAFLNLACVPPDLDFIRYGKESLDSKATDFSLYMAPLLDEYIGLDRIKNIMGDANCVVYISRASIEQRIKTIMMKELSAFVAKTTFDICLTKLDEITIVKTGIPLSALIMEGKAFAVDPKGNFLSPNTGSYKLVEKKHEMVTPAGTTLDKEEKGMAKAQLKNREQPALPFQPDRDEIDRLRTARQREDVAAFVSTLPLVESGDLYYTTTRLWVNLDEVVILLMNTLWDAVRSYKHWKRVRNAYFIIKKFVQKFKERRQMSKLGSHNETPPVPVPSPQGKRRSLPSLNDSKDTGTGGQQFLTKVKPKRDQALPSRRRSMETPSQRKAAGKPFKPLPTPRRKSTQAVSATTMTSDNPSSFMTQEEVAALCVKIAGEIELKN